MVPKQFRHVQNSFGSIKGQGKSQYWKYFKNWADDEWRHSSCETSEKKNHSRMFCSSHIFVLWFFGVIGHFSCMIFFPFISVSPNCLTKCKQRLSNIFVTSTPKVTKDEKWDERNKRAQNLENHSNSNVISNSLWPHCACFFYLFCRLICDDERRHSSCVTWRF